MKHLPSIAIASILIAGAFTGVAGAQETASKAPVKESTGQGGVNRMRDLMDAIQRKDYSGLPEDVSRALQTGVVSAESSADLSNAPESTVKMAVTQSDNWLQAAREAYVAALPPRDRALGQRVILGDGGLSDEGRLYFFVSRSMPISLLRAYALDALYTGATLVVKGIRKGETMKDFVENTVLDFNSSEGQHLAALEVNPNLFDMFGVSVVPATVWTNRGGLDDIGSGCSPLPESVKPELIQLEGPNDTVVTVEKPTCDQVPSSTYLKITGALKIQYVLDRFEKAGMPKKELDAYRKRLAELTSNEHQEMAQPQQGNAMTPLMSEIKVDMMPRHILEYWKEQLAENNVQRSPFGPAFGPDDEDDPEYRKELQTMINHGLGL